ncbi:MAG: Na+/H+ antiporter NhaA [Anaerolineae bacterium]
MLSPRFDDTLRRAPAKQALYIFQEFSRLEATSGMLLLICAAVALFLANGALAETYSSLFETHLSISLGSLTIDESLHHWINDGLKALIFFVVGLEIKREITTGELSSPSRALLPIIAALGGMVAPALIYVGINLWADGALNGWGIPMATDIAFTLGALALLGSRVPTALKVFVTALAIVDDIGAVVVIALFYTAEIAVPALLIGVLLLVAAFTLNRIGVRRLWPFGLIGIAMWLAFLYSGVHATLAGVLLAFTIPHRAQAVDPTVIGRAMRMLTDVVYRPDLPTGHAIVGSAKRQAILQELSNEVDRAESPLQRFEHMLHPWVSFVILPVFAFANAGVTMDGGSIAAALTSPIGMGIALGLIFGKTIGISLFTWVAVKLGIAELPRSISWTQLFGVATLAGIGFTMSIFISTLAFGTGGQLDTAKIGIIVASITAGLIGWTVLWLADKRQPEQTLQPA